MRDNIIFPDFLQEMADYESDYGQFISKKAQRVWALCIDQGHFNLARRIYDKYVKHKPDDRLIAFQYALMASQKPHQ